MFKSKTALTAVIAACSLVLFLGGCGEQPDLPTTIASPDNFGANDTSFVRVAPDWNSGSGYDLDNPTDIQVGRDGLLYITDHNTTYGEGGRVLQVTRGGGILKNDLFADYATADNPIEGIGQDSRLNLFMVRGDSNVYIWNQYLSQEGIEAMVQQLDVVDNETGDTSTVDLTQAAAWEMLQEYGENFRPLWETAVETQDPGVLDPYREEYVFYQDTTRFLTEFTDVDAGVDLGQLVRLTDRYTDRIISVWVMPDKIVRSSDGEYLYTYVGVYDPFMDVVSQGTGPVSTNNPTGVVTARITGNTHEVFFTQIGQYYKVQKLRGSGQEWFFDFASTPAGEPEVMRLDYFGAPMAIAVAEKDERGLGLFYVADSAQHRVPAFYGNGFLFREVAFDEHLIDLTLGDSLSEVLDLQFAGLDTLWQPSLNPTLPLEYVAPVDTTVRVRMPILYKPQGVATLEGVVYIADSGNDRVLRFKRSDANSYLPDEGE